MPDTMLIRIKPQNARATHVFAGYTIEKSRGWYEVPADVARAAKQERMSDADPNSAPVFDVKAQGDAQAQVEEENYREDPAGTPEKPLRLRPIAGAVVPGRGDLAAHDLTVGNNPSADEVAHLDRPNMAEADAAVRLEVARAGAAEAQKAAAEQKNLKAQQRTKAAAQRAAGVKAQGEQQGQKLEGQQGQKLEGQDGAHLGEGGHEPSQQGANPKKK